MDRPALRRVLLSLLCPKSAPPPEVLARIDGEDWQAIDAMAAEHRLRPLLHAGQGGNPAIPPGIAQGWHAAWRESALEAMTQKADLIATVATLRAAGIEPLVLKGGWLAWQAYSHPAERPMRDLDLLVPEAQVLAAVAALQAAGYAWVEEPDLPVTDLIRFDKSLPGLVAPRGTEIELHLHAWHPSGRLEYPSPEPDDAGMFARARTGPDGLRYPAPADMLAHLIIHAAYSHRLDCGPLLLSDIALLVAAEPIDWPAFWERTRREGWREGARLVLELVAHWRAPPGLDLSADPGPQPPPATLEAASDLLLQKLSARLSAGFLVAALSGGPRVLWQRLRRKVPVAAAEGSVRRDLGERNYVEWAVSRLRRMLGDLADPDVRRQTRDLARLSHWIAGPVD